LRSWSSTTSDVSHRSSASPPPSRGRVGFRMAWRVAARRGSTRVAPTALCVSLSPFPHVIFCSGAPLAGVFSTTTSERQPALAARAARPNLVSRICVKSPFEGAWVEGGWGGGKALILRTPPPDSQSAPARAQVLHGRHEQLRLPTTGIGGQLPGDGGSDQLRLRHRRAMARVRSDHAVPAARRCRRLGRRPPPPLRTRRQGRRARRERRPPCMVPQLATTASPSICSGSLCFTHT